MCINCSLVSTNYSSVSENCTLMIKNLTEIDPELNQVLLEAETSAKFNLVQSNLS